MASILSRPQCVKSLLVSVMLTPGRLKQLIIIAVFGAMGEPLASSYMYGGPLLG